MTPLLREKSLLNRYEHSKSCAHRFRNGLPFHTPSLPHDDERIVVVRREVLRCTHRRRSLVIAGQEANHVRLLAGLMLKEGDDGVLHLAASEAATLMARKMSATESGGRTTIHPSHLNHRHQIDSCDPSLWRSGSVRYSLAFVSMRRWVFRYFSRARFSRRSSFRQNDGHGRL